MSKGLKIYACSGVGAVDINKYIYWTDGTKDYQNSPAVNSLLAQINELNVEATYLQLTEAERVEKYNELDFYLVCLVLAQQNMANEQKATVLQKMCNAGDFAFDSTDDSQREQHLDDLVAAATGDGTTYEKSGDVYRYFVSEIVDRNKVLFTAEQQKKIATALESVSGVGATDYGSLTQYINDAGFYFMYRFIPAAQRSKLSAGIRQKIKKQDETYQYVLNNWAPAYGTQADLDSVIRTKIIADTGATPEQGAQALLKKEGIGDWVAIVTVVITCLSFIASVISSFWPKIQSAIAAKATAKYAVPDNVESGCPDADDWDDAGTTTSTSGSSLLKWGLIGAVLFLIFKK